MFNNSINVRIVGLRFDRNYNFKSLLKLLKTDMM